MGGVDKHKLIFAKYMIENKKAFKPSFRLEIYATKGACGVF